MMAEIRFQPLHKKISINYFTQMYQSRPLFRSWPHECLPPHSRKTYQDFIPRDCPALGGKHLTKSYNIPMSLVLGELVHHRMVQHDNIHNIRVQKREYNLEAGVCFRWRTKLHSSTHMDESWKKRPWSFLIFKVQNMKTWDAYCWRLWKINVAISSSTNFTVFISF